MEVEPLEWDSNLFGFRVARLTATSDDGSRVSAALERARRDGVRLVYLFDPTCGEFPTSMLAPFSGRLVDRRVNYERALGDNEQRDARIPVEGINIEEYNRSTADSELRALAVTAGEYSRFRVDPGIPRVAFETLYETWIERSVRREIADSVLVASGPESPCAGLLTVRRREQTGVIGLVAVAAEVRGRGIGRRLMSAAHDWMCQAGINESCGYHVAQREHIYHFWLSSDAA
jgi:dTDP-4-amino-4,6-dideoxy-D-galactose acyltransferase